MNSNLINVLINIVIIAAGILLPQTVWACPCPPCYEGSWPSCYYVGCEPDCNDCEMCHTIDCSGCDNICTEGQVCCDDGCCSGTCCGGSCCWAVNCQDCINDVCKSKCDPNGCQTCVGYSCETTCSPGQECCGDTPNHCEYPCDLDDGEVCEKPIFPPDYNNCGLTCCLSLDPDCYVDSEKIWSGGIGITGKICNPTGCPGDCNHDIEMCWEEYECVPTGEYYLLRKCTNVYVSSSNPPIVHILPYYTCLDNFPNPTKCYLCDSSSYVLDDHYVEYDSCN